MTRRILSEEVLTFVVPGKALTRGAPTRRMTRESDEHELRGAQSYKALIRMVGKFAVAEQGWKLDITKSYYVLITINVGAGAINRASQQKKLWSGEQLAIRAPDTDRILSLIMNALAGVVWVKKRQVVGVLVVKKYNQKEEGVEVLVGNPRNWRELNHDLRNA